MKSSKLLFVVVLFVTLVAGSARAQGKKVHVVCTLPTLKALTEEVGGERVDVIALAKGDQRARIAAFGGREAIIARGSFGYSPTPGTKPVYN